MPPLTCDSRRGGWCAGSGPSRHGTLHLTPEHRTTFPNIKSLERNYFFIFLLICSINYLSVDDILSHRYIHPLEINGIDLASEHVQACHFSVVVLAILKIVILCGGVVGGE